MRSLRILTLPVLCVASLAVNRFYQHDVTPVLKLLPLFNEPQPRSPHRSAFVDAPPKLS